MAEIKKEDATLDANVPILSRLRPPAGAVRKKKRRCRGIGSGLGKTGGKGQKGQKARHPGDFGKRGFEGGQMPLHRRLPKVGFHNPFSREVATVNLRDLERFESGAVVNVAALVSKGLVNKKDKYVKVLATGDINKPLKVQVQAFSASAKSKLEKAGGTAEVVS